MPLRDFIPLRDFELRDFVPLRDFELRDFVPLRDFELRDFIPIRDFEQRDFVPLRYFELRDFVPGIKYQRDFVLRDFEIEPNFMVSWHAKMRAMLFIGLSNICCQQQIKIKLSTAVA